MNIKYINLRKKNKTRTAFLSFLVIMAVILSSYFGAFSKRSECTAATSTKPENRSFIIDAGHGGEDPGAISDSGVFEKDINLDIALLIGEELMKKGYNVIYTRTEDKLLYTEKENIHGIRKICDLRNRCRIAKENPDAIFLSIHMNSFSESKYSGLQTYYSAYNEESRALADSIQSRVRNDLQKENNRKIKEGNNMYVMENIENIGVLVECGFLTNSDEAKKLCEKEYQKMLSFSIVCGIIDYIEKN